MNSISKNVYTNKLYGMVNKYNDTYHSTIKMKLFAVKSNTFIDSSNLITKIFTLKTKQIFAKGCTPNQPEEVLVIRKVKNTILLTYAINDLNGEEIVGTFNKKRIVKKQIKKSQNWKSNQDKRR